MTVIRPTKKQYLWQRRLTGEWFLTGTDRADWENEEGRSFRAFVMDGQIVDLTTAFGSTESHIRLAYAALVGAEQG